MLDQSLVSQIVFLQGGMTRMTTTKTCDYLHPMRCLKQCCGTGNRVQVGLPATSLRPVSSVSHGVNRLTGISSSSSSSSSFNCTYNAANQRTQDTLADGSYWIYGVTH